MFRAVLIDRNPTTRQDDPIALMAGALDAGTSLILFPEGTRNTTDERLLPFKSGLYHLAGARPQVELVPVWIENLNRVMPKGEFVPIPLLCTVTFGAPLRLQAGEDKAAFLERAQRGAARRRARAGDRPMTATEQTLALFGGIAGVLVVASLVGFVLERRYAAHGPNAVIENLNSRIKSWWVMVIAIGIAFAFGKAGVIVLFGFASFTALREFVTLLSTRRGDHLALVIAFFVVLPAQYYLIWIDWYGLYSIFIPVYAFLLLPIIAALRGDTKAFMPRVAEVQWALMICVFCVSHVPALLTLNIPGYEGRQLLLIAFLVLVVQSSDVLQYVWGKLAGRHKIAPLLSPSKTVEGFVGGVASATLVGAALWWITPFSSVAGRRDGARHHPDGLLRRAGDVGDQARPRRQGLGPADRRPWRHARPARTRSSSRRRSSSTSRAIGGPCRRPGIGRDRRARSRRPEGGELLHVARIDGDRLGVRYCHCLQNGP